MAPPAPPRSIRKDRRSHSIHTGRRVVELRVRQTDDRRRGNCRSDLAVVSHDLHAPGTEHLTRGAGDYAFPKAGPGNVTFSLAYLALLAVNEPSSPMFSIAPGTPSHSPSSVSPIS